MDWYKSFAAEKRRTAPDMRKVKVAVIDNGFDWESLKEYKPDGESFVYHGGKEQNWFFASDLHGTQMATFITQLNPFCELYLAKVGHLRRDIKSDAVQDVSQLASSDLFP
jgi:hypothetical protein